MNLLSIEGLRCFSAAARQLNFRSAARVVGLSPAAFGQRIRQLEDEIGEGLFLRTTRSVTLTEAGLRLQPTAERALSVVEDCRRAGRGELAATPIELVLGTRHELGLSWIVPMLPTLERALPGLTMHLYFGSGNDLSQRVRSLEIDCAVSSTRVFDPKLVAMKMHEEKYAFVGASRLLARTPLRSANDALAHTLLDTTAELPLFRYFSDTRGSIDSLAFGRVVRLGTIAAIRHQVLRGAGVAVLPRYFVEEDLRSKRLALIMPRVQPQSDWFRLLYRSDDPRRTVFERLGELMREQPLRA